MMLRCMSYPPLISTVLYCAALLLLCVLLLTDFSHRRLQYSTVQYLDLSIIQPQCAALDDIRGRE